MFVPILHLSRPHSPSTLACLSPLAHMIEALDHCGRVHTLQRQEIDPNDEHAVDRRKDGTRTLTSSAERWLVDAKLKDGAQDGMTLVIVSPLRQGDSS